MNILVRSLAVWSCATVLWLSALLSTSAQTAQFDLKGVTLDLQEVTPDTSVFFRSLRPNRALNQWNVEVTVSNRSDRALSGPLVLLVESFRGTSGPLLADGNLPGAAPRAFYDLSALVPGGDLLPHQSTGARTLSLGFTTGAPVLVTRVFAGSLPPPLPVGVTRSLNDVGQPLAATTMTVTGPAGGTSVVQTTDRPSGVASFGDAAGLHVLKFSQEGSLPVWRQQILSTGSVAVAPNPRLTPRSSRAVEVTPLGGSVVTNEAGTIRISINAGAFAGSASLRLTSLTGQTLPSFLPPAWSPLQAFHLETSSTLSQGLPASLKPIGPIAAAETAALVRWNETTLAWDVVQLVNGRGTEPVDVLLPGGGSFALVVGDTRELAPPAPVVGQPLPSGSLPVEATEEFTAAGIVDPSSSPASQVPVRVTGQATVTLRHPASKLPSGTLVRGEVTETYVLKDGATRITPSYEQFLVAYQRPGDDDPQTLHAVFPMRPLLLFGAEELSAATVRIEVLPLSPFDGRVVDQRGGQLAFDQGRVRIGAGQLSAPTAFRIRPLSLSPFTNALSTPMQPVSGFEITFDGSRLTGTLTSRFDGLATNSWFVLAKVLSEVGLYGFEPVERLQSDASGVVSTAEPTSGDRLPGIRSSGHYVLIRVGQPQGLISGVARDGKGGLRAGMPVRATGAPWLALTDEQGRFRLVSAVGAQQIEVTDPATGDTGSSFVTVTDPRQSVVQDLASAPAGPKVVVITPADEARKVPVVTPITIQFSEPVNPATILGNGIQLLGPGDAVVSSAVSLNLANRVATLSPGSDLTPGTVYKVVLAETIADPSGLKLEGPSQFTFTTAAISTRDASSQLVIYQPGATNVPVAILDQIPAYEPGQDPTAVVVHGTPGAADPEVPVVLVNESTGETATVLSKVDGSFSSVISGAEDDFISATFVNLNRTRVYVPVSRQEFDNGFVGLYRTGGILEAESDGGPVQVIIKPEAIPDRSKFRLRRMTPADLAKELGGVKPETGKLVGSGLRLELEGNPPNQPIQVRVPVDLTQYGFPTNSDPLQAAAVLTRVLDTDGVKTFQVLDQMRFTPSAPGGPPPLARPRLAGIDNEKFFGYMDTAFGFIPGAIGDIGQPLFQFVIVPMLLGGQSIVIKGFTYESPKVPAAGEPIKEAATQAYWDSTKARALSGVFVILRQVAVARIGPPGRLEPGMIHATSDQLGKYLIVAPSFDDAYIITASHPRFLDRENEPVVGLLDLGLAGLVRKDLYFREPAAALSPPRLNIAHSPLYPAPGVACTVQVNASQGDEAPPKIAVRIKSARRLSDGEPVSPEVLALLQLKDVVEETFDGNRARYTAKLTSPQPLFVTVSVVAQGQNGIGHPPLEYPIAFAGAPPSDPDSPIIPSDPTEKTGPAVLATIPSDQGYVDESGTVILEFNEPINGSVLNDSSGIRLVGAGADLRPGLTLSEDQRRLTLRFPGLSPGSTFSLSLSGQSIRDLNGNPLDQRPSTPEPDGFVMTFQTIPQLEKALGEVSNGKGAVISGQRLYVLDHDATGSLLTYSLEFPNSPVLLSRTRLLGAPRDLVVIPRYSYKLTAEVGSPVKTGEIVAVVGGDLDTIIDDLDSVIVKGQYLMVFDTSDGAHPVQLASPIVSRRVASALVKLRWDAPNLVYQEFGTDFNQIAAVNLQELIVGFNSPRHLQDTFPPGGVSGLDKNADGDYVDPEDIVPQPMRRPPEFYGKRFGYVLDQTTQKVIDFSTGGGAIGVTLTSGYLKDENGRPFGARISPQYRTVALNGFEPDPTAASYNFHSEAYPKRVTIVEGLPLRIAGQIATPLVAIVSLTPDHDGKQKLVFVDITLPESKTNIAVLEIPDNLVGGFVQSVEYRRNGFLEIFTSQNALLVNPIDLTLAHTNAATLHPSIVAFVPHAGAGTRSVGSSDFGLRAVAEGGRANVVQTAPSMHYVLFPEAANVLTPGTYPRTDAGLDKLFNSMAFVEQMVSSRFREEAGVPSDLLPPRPIRHYHVLVEAPGSAGKTIQLGLESLNPAGWPLPNRGPEFVPVRALDSATLKAIDQVARPSCDAPIRPLPAYRLSDDPASPYYNRYLSRAIALICSERVSPTELEGLRSTIDREIMWSGAFLRAFIEPSEQFNAVVGRFAAKIDTDRVRILPMASVTARTLNIGMAPGDNVPPVGGGAPLSGTQGTIGGHNGEFRTSSVDMSIPGRRMPIEIVRSIGGQDAYDGPFGLGWDFNYNQRITELDASLFPEGVRIPLVAKEPIADSVVGGSRDVLLHTGQSRILLFRWISDKMPPEYAQDPLVARFEYDKRVSDYYLPEPGLFDLLVKFKDGRYERLTPAGSRYRYAANGRLETIIEAYPRNRHDLEYDRNGWLVRIDDRSVSTDRFIRFGYYRRKSDPDFVKGLDEVTSNGFVEGRICRLKDYADGDVLFFYNDEGLLIRREGMLVSGDNGGFSGRAKIFYNYEACKIVGMSLTGEGTPFFTADAPPNAANQKIAQSGGGIGGTVKVDVPKTASSKTLKDMITSSTRQDGSKVEHVHNANGLPTSTQVSGPKGETVKIDQEYNEHGQPTRIRYPLGRVVTMVYDTLNPIYRSRGNLLESRVDPGPLGGETTVQTYSYDPRYNQASGPQKTANNNVVTMTLTADGRSTAQVQTGAAGIETAQYNEYGQIIRSVGLNGIESSTEFDASTGFLLSHTQGETVTRQTYDGSYASKMGLPSQIIPPIGEPTRLRHNQNLQTVEVVRGELVSQTTYDEQGRAVKSREVVGDGRALVNHMGIDARGFVYSSLAEGIEVNGVITSIEHRFEADALGRVKKVILPEGVVQEFEYDNRGNVVVSKVGKHTEEYEYDLHNNPTTAKIGGVLVSRMEYDGNDRLVRTTTYTGESESTEVSTFFPGGELKTFQLTDSRYGPLLQQTYSAIDELGRPKDVTLNGNLISPRYQYTYEPLQNTVIGPRMTSVNKWDRSGNNIEYSDPIVTSRSTVKLNGLLEKIESIEQGATYFQAYEYDNLDNRTQASDALGVMMKYTPRADGATMKVENARGNSSSFEYTALGEPISETRTDGLAFKYEHDAQRRPSYVGDPTAGFRYEYDQLRLASSSLRNGAKIVYSDFDERNLPRTVTIPGGRMTQRFDLQGKLLQQTIEYQGRTREMSFKYDGLSRVRDADYSQGQIKSRAEYAYDLSGVLLRSHHVEDGFDSTVSYGYYADGISHSVKYPSGAEITEERDPVGRLIALSVGGADIARVGSWKGNAQARSVDVGGVLDLINDFDVRGRLVSSQWKRKADGSVIAEMRYGYDLVDNLSLRQFVHRGGRVDRFGYDGGERLVQAALGGIPLTEQGDGPVSVLRQYTYQPTGLDHLVSTTTTSANQVDVPAFADRWANHDAFLLPTVVAGFNRGSADPQGNVNSIQLWTRPQGRPGPVPVPATLTHDGLGALTRVALTNGLTIENLLQPSGMRYSRRTSSNGVLVENRHFVYDTGGRLLEEYLREGGNDRLAARYYYTSSDAPYAADLPDPADGLLKRYYYIRDGALSVIGLADAQGRMVERVWYDGFGQPMIEQRDEKPPVLQRVVMAGNGVLRLVFSEPVMPRREAAPPAQGLVTASLQIPSPITVVPDVGGIQPGVASIVWDAPEGVAGSVVEWKAASPVSGAATLRIPAGAVMDEWGNTNSLLTARLTLVPDVGAVVFSTNSPSTAPMKLARSAVQNPFLFQGQYMDYDTGLMYFRARFYDPFSGMFLEPDPAGYAETVNHYAVMGNNPVTMRDPSGLISGVAGGWRLGATRFLSKNGLTDLEMTAVMNVLNARSENITLSIRKFVKYDDLGRAITDVDTAWWRRHWASMSMRVKGVASKAKNNNYARGVQKFTGAERVGSGTFSDETVGKGSVFRNVESSYDVTGDLDALHVEIDGRFATIDEIRDLFGDINKEFHKLHKQKFGHMGAARPKPNPPFQHEAHAHLLHQVGNRIGKQASSEKGGLGFVSYHDIGKIGHPQDAFVIESTGAVGDKVFRARDLSRQEIGTILQRGLDDFLATREATVHSKLFHRGRNNKYGRWRPGDNRRKLDGSIMTRDDLEAMGYFDIKAWPDSFNYFKDGTRGISGMYRPWGGGY